MEFLVIKILKTRCPNIYAFKFNKTIILNWPFYKSILTELINVQISVLLFSSLCFEEYGSFMPKNLQF